MTPEADTLVANKYRLVRELASGGMGSVWVAHHTDLEVDVAIKFMLEKTASRELGRQRFKREARAAAQLRSPHVTQILDYGVWEGAPYIAMELLVGRGLDDVMAQEAPLTLERTALIVSQLCRGLRVAHAAGIIHRDLKPSNVFLARVGDEEIVKILDFGVAKDQTAQFQVGAATASGALVGSPRYMSPEQTIGDDLDARSDLWSVALIAYEMVTGLHPFQEQHLGQLLQSIASKAVPAPTSLVPVLPDSVDELFDRALARKREGRFASATELGEALEAVAAGKPCPPPRSKMRPVAASPRGRVEATDEVAPVVERSSPAFESTVRVPSADELAAAAGTPVDTPPNRIESGSSAPRPGSDATGAGLGVDSVSQSEPRSRRVGAWVAAAAAGIAAVAAAWVMATRPDDVLQAPAGTAEPPSRPTATASEAPHTATAAVPAPVPTPTASVSVSVSSSLPTAVAGPPPKAWKPPPTTPPPPATTDPLFGLPNP
jgi:eukaryotic-like serine/threonine-protein kinase